MKRLFLIVFTGLALLATVAKGQSKPVLNAIDTKIKLAEQILTLTGADKQLEQTQEAVISQMSLQVPPEQRTKFNQLTGEFFQKYCSWAVLKADICTTYASVFTEAELKQLLAFYQSPVGTKLLQNEPEIARSVKVIAQRAFTEHKSELITQLNNTIKQ